MVTALLLAAIVFYLMLATMIFRQDKLELVFDLNKSVVTTLATEVDSTLRGVADKLRLYAYFIGQGKVQADRSAFKQMLSNDPLLIRLELFAPNNTGQMISQDQIVDENYEKTYGLAADFFTRTLAEKHPIPFATIKAKSISVWNATTENGPPLLGMGIPVIREGANGIPDRILSAVAYIKADVFLKNMKSSRLNQVFILDQDSKVLVHTIASKMLKQVDYSQSEIVRSMKESQVSVGVKEYQDNGRQQLGAFAKVQTGQLTVISQVESEKAFVAVKSLIRRSLLYAMIISTITFIATVLFSRTLTHPLRRLMTAMERVSEGNLDTEFSVKSHDEIAVLSNSFNRMTQDLKTSRLQLEEINRELENKVIDRTKKLEEQNRAVKEAQEALLRTTRLASVGEIAGRTAHEVLNPLTSLMARIQKVQKRLNNDIGSNKNLLGEILGAWKKDLNEKGLEGLIKSLEEPSKINPGINLLQEDLGNFNAILSAWDKDLLTLDTDTKFLMQQALRIEKILRQMRSLSVVSGQRKQLHAQPLIHDAVNIVADLFAKNRVELRETLVATEDNVRVDRDELIQVLTNMLRNSLQAVLEKNSTQKIVEIQTSLQGKKLLIDIIDNGIGISVENKPKLFENQFSTKAPEEGTGLGLSISRRFVRAVNGDVYLLKTSVKEGTTFRIELPLDSTNNEGVAA
jgi:signal transduction histidine kinase